MAEWLMALVLKTSRLTSRRFESCPFRQIEVEVVKNKPLRGLFFSGHSLSVDACVCRYVCDYCCDSVSQQVSL